MNEHHDHELCRRLAEKVFDWWVDEDGPHIDGILQNELFDPCCNPAHTHLIMKEMQRRSYMLQVNLFGDDAEGCCQATYLSGEREWITADSFGLGVSRAAEEAVGAEVLHAV